MRLSGLKKFFSRDTDKKDEKLEIEIKTEERDFESGVGGFGRGDGGGFRTTEKRECRVGNYDSTSDGPEVVKQ